MAEHEAINNVRRKINEVMKKTDERIVVGWRPTLEEKRNEGDVWEDSDGRKWTVKNGIKQNVTKLDLAKTPWFCPHCQKSMNHWLDGKFWNLRGKCFDCVIADEAQIRAEGKWEEYEQQIMKANYIASLKDKIAELQYYHDTVSSPTFVHADDERILMIEKWNVDIDRIKAELLIDIEDMKKHLAEIEAED
jgi:ribosomal protein L33